MYKKLLLPSFFLFLIILLIPPLYTRWQMKSKTYSNPMSIPSHYSALILGAGIDSANQPTDILQDRLRFAAALYKLGKVQKLILSGDNRTVSYNEPQVMQETLVKLGIPKEATQPDYAGRRTFASCYRAKTIFSQTDTIIITQSFHLSRALFICNQLGINSVGLISDVDRYDPVSWTYWTIRDSLSFYLSLIDLYIRQPSTVPGPKISI